MVWVDQKERWGRIGGNDQGREERLKIIGVTDLFLNFIPYTGYT